MIVKQIIFFGKPCLLACDGNCEKAWGINTRPRVRLHENDPDDYASLSDRELGIAPVDPGTYECGFGKPTDPDARLNKWCARECERSAIVDMAEAGKLFEIKLPDFRRRQYNMHSRQKEADKKITRELYWLCSVCGLVEVTACPKCGLDEDKLLEK